MFKVIGGVFVVIASMGLGFSFCEDLGQRRKVLSDIRQMMQYLINRIEVECDTLMEAFLHTSKRVEGPFCEFLMRVYQRMMKQEGLSIKEIWEEEAKEFECVLIPKDLENFQACMGQTGFSQKEQQIRVMAEYISCLDEEIKEMDRTKNEKCKVYKTLGIMTGILLVVILW